MSSPRFSTGRRTSRRRSTRSSISRRCRSSCRTRPNDGRAPTSLMSSTHAERFMKKGLTLFLAALAALAFNGAHAHGSTKPQHGGVVQLVGETSVELVAGAEGAEVYVMYDGEDVSSDGMTGKLTVDNAGAKSETALQPAGANKFEAKGVKISGGSKVVVS